MSVIPNAFSALQNPPFNPNTVTGRSSMRTSTAGYDSVSLEVQRGVHARRGVASRVRRHEGKALFNRSTQPTVMVARRRRAAKTSAARSQTRARRVCAPTPACRIYTRLKQVWRRLSAGFSAGLHYTYSSSYDTMSRSSTCRPARLPSRKTRTIAATIGRGSVSIRPHRLAGTSFTSCLTSAIRRASPVTGAGQISTLSRTPEWLAFHAAQRFGPAGALASISALVGNAIRPNINTTLNHLQHSVEEILRAGGRSSHTHHRGATRRQRGTQHPALDGINNMIWDSEEHTDRREPTGFSSARLFNFTNSRDFGIPDSTVTSKTS